MKHKRVILVATAIVFLLVLFYIKNYSSEENITNNQASLNYTGNETLEELVVKDTDGDGISDWEEGLWGTDLSKKDSDEDGESDDSEISKLKESPNNNSQTPLSEEPLTETDKFARELFSTAAALNQGGAMGGEAIEGLTTALAEKLKNPLSGKIYILSQVKTIPDNSVAAVAKYDKAASAVLMKKYPVNEKIVKIFQESFTPDQDIDQEVLTKLNPIIKDLNEITAGLLALQVPSELSYHHLKLINSFQKLSENLQNIKLTEKDPVLAVSAIAQYSEVIVQLELAIHEITLELNKKLKV